jgi:hypothetical protein
LRQLAEATDYDGLIGAFRNRAAELQVAGETIDEVAGLPARYSAKLLGPNQVRRIGAVSLGPLLGALALKLIIVEDEDALRQYGSRLKRRNPNLVRNKRNTVVHVTRTRREFREMGKIGGPLSRSYMSKKRAGEIGRTAAQARWSKPRVTEIKGKKARAA